MIVLHQDAVGIAVDPIEGYSPLIIDADRPSGRTAVQLLQPVGDGYAQIVKPGSGIQALQLELGTALDVVSHAADEAALENIERP